MSSSKAYTFVADQAALLEMLDDLTNLCSDKPDIFVDLEGENLSRTGSISILQLFLLPKLHVYLIDVLTLGSEAFETSNSTGTTFKSILESTNVRKAFFDVRNDSAAMYHQYQISLANADDIQLMENATRNGWNKCVNGLARCIEHDAALSAAQRQSWLSMKEFGKRMFDPKLGGSYAVFNQRPLTEKIQNYCVQDVLILPTLWIFYSSKLTTTWRQLAAAESEMRIAASRSPRYDGKGKHMALAPSGWTGRARSTHDRGNGVSPSLSNSKVSEALRIMLDFTLKPVDPPVGLVAPQQTPLDSAIHALESLRLVSNDVPRRNEAHLASVVLRGGGARFPSSINFDGEDDLFDDDESSGGDFIACSTEDCGYCGHCGY
ncbi:hypothetical protein MMC25_006108 [Agyrium rufum]|nr:hypothetical protein [Agyrium rufum]